MTKTDWTAEEVRKAISGFAGYCYSHHGIGSEMIDIAYAFAERIEADESAECSPMLTECPRCKNNRSVALADPKCWMTHPPAQPAQNHPHSPNAADSGRVGDEVVERARSLLGRALYDAGDIFASEDVTNPRKLGWLEGLRTVLADFKAALAAQGQGEPVAWPTTLACHPVRDGSGDRILGFRISDGDPILGEYGLSEPLDWLRRHTTDRHALAASPAGVPDGWRIERVTPRKLMVCGNGKRIEIDFGDMLYPYFAKLAPSATPEGGEVEL
jgi:hypothetical protein